MVFGYALVSPNSIAALKYYFIFCLIQHRNVKLRKEETWVLSGIRITKFTNVWNNNALRLASNGWCDFSAEGIAGSAHQYSAWDRPTQMKSCHSWKLQFCSKEDTIYMSKGHSLNSIASYRESEKYKFVSKVPIAIINLKTYLGYINFFTSD